MINETIVVCVNTVTVLYLSYTIADDENEIQIYSTSALGVTVVFSQRRMKTEQRIIPRSFSDLDGEFIVSFFGLLSLPQSC